MRPLRALGIYAVAVFLGGALLAPWLYWLVQNFSHAFPHLAETRFQNYLSSTMTIVAVAGIWPLLRSLGATSLKEAGLTNPIGHGSKILAGLLFGLISLGAITALALIFGAREVHDNLAASRLVKKVSMAVVTAAGVGVLEETLFRGGVFGGLRRVFQWPFALVVSSVIYALTHFIANAKFSGAVTWTSGLELLPSMFGADAGWAAGTPRFLNLTLAGALLGLAYQRTGNLWFSIGLHAGWVFWLATYRVFTQAVPGASAWFWGGGKIIDGWLALPVLALTLAVFTRLPLSRMNTFRT